MSDAAAAQRGVVSLAQLHSCGLSRTSVSRWAGDGRLHRVLPGVYAVGHRTLTREGWWTAVVLACGPGATLAGRTSTALWSLTAPITRVDVIVPTWRGIHLPGIRVRRSALRAEERTVARGLPVTTPSRALFDLAATEGAGSVGPALDSALLDGRYDHEEMTALLERHRGARGIRALRTAIARAAEDGPLHVRSRAERRARDLLVAAGLPTPEVNAWVPTQAGMGHELDLLLRRLRLNIEIDGPRHEQPWQRQHDRLRDRDLWDFHRITVVRFPVALLDAAPERSVARCEHEIALRSARG